MRNDRLLASFGFAIVAAALYAPQAALAACTPTGFNITTGYGSTSGDDGNPVVNMTAAMVNPGNVSGDVNASGCDIGVYFGPGQHGQVSHANVRGAKYHGIVNNGANVDIEDSSISDIGDLTSGVSRGYGIFVYGGAGRASGDIHGNTVWRYQKNGIVVAGQHADANVESNWVIGQGQTPRIAQNGIEVIDGADAQVTGNVVTGDAYTGGGSGVPPGENQAAGILIYGGECYPGVPTALVTGIRIEHNVVTNSDIGVELTNCASPGVAATTPTKNTVDDNALINNAVTSINTAPPYQAGIQAIGAGDTITDNDTCGPGFADSAPAHAIDAALDTGAKLKNNTVCRPLHDQGHGHSH